MKGWLRAHRKGLLFGLGGIVVLFAGLLILWARCGLHGCPDVNRLKAYMPNKASTIVDYRGREVGKLFLTRSVIVSIDSIPAYVPNAFIAMEDKRFWQHKGIDWRRVLGAAYINIKSLGVKEGSSTITMQLARNTFPDHLPASKRTMFRKTAEMRVAQNIEQTFSKKEILQLYLNQIYFGNGARGIEAAAQEYFGRHAKDLTLPQAAMLAALPRAPSRLNPRHDPEEALTGRRDVLERMLEQKLISRDEADSAANAKLRLRHGTSRANQPAPYFVETVRQILEDELGDAIYTKSLTIHTTLDIDLQRTLEQELARQTNAIERGAYGTFRHPTLAAEQADTSDEVSETRYLQDAAVFMDTHTGDVRALVGGRNFGDSEYNRALNARRQLGSAFKPFVYAAAFQRGYAPTYKLSDAPLRLVVSRNNTWAPKNYDNKYGGPVSMRDALAHSKNLPTIRLANEIGINRVIGVARQMGLKGRIPAVPSVVLGTAETTPIDITEAYAAFATLGERPSPRFVTKVVNRDGVELWSQPVASPRKVLDPAVAFMTVSLMQEVIDRGSAVVVRDAGFMRPAAGKTGTTNNVADIWFIGFTPDIVGTIWMGFDKQQPIVQRETGGDLAAEVWGRVMRQMDVRGGGWTPPARVEMHIVNGNGDVVDQRCAAPGFTRREYFLKGTAPPARCYTPFDSTRSKVAPTQVAPGAARDAKEGFFRRMSKRIFGEEKGKKAPAAAIVRPAERKKAPAPAIVRPAEPPVPLGRPARRRIPISPGSIRGTPIDTGRSVRDTTQHPDTTIEQRDTSAERADTLPIAAAARARRTPSPPVP